MKKAILFSFLTFFCVNSNAQLQGSSLGNATCEDFIFDKNKIYFTGSYQNYFSVNGKDTFNSTSPGSFLFGSVDTLLENFKPIIALSEGSFIRGQKIIGLSDGKKIIVCLTNGNSEINGKKIISNGGWDILLLFISKNDELIETCLIGSPSNDAIIDHFTNGTVFNLLFKSGNNMKVNSTTVNTTINDFGYVIYQFDGSKMSETINKISELNLNSKLCFIPISFYCSDKGFKAFGYYSSKENVNKINSTKEFGILSGNYGTNYIFKKIIQSNGLSSKTYFTDNTLVFDITSKVKSEIKSSFYLFKNGNLSRLEEDIQSSYHYIGDIKKIDNEKYYCIGSYQNRINNSNNYLSKEDGESFIFYFDFMSNECLLENISQPNIRKSIYKNGYCFTSSSYTNTSTNQFNEFNNFRISKLKIDYITKYEILKRELENKKSIIYPNPAINMVTISTQIYYHNLKLRLINTEGQLLYETFFKKNSKNLDIDITLIPNGNYFVELYQGDNLISTLKLVVCK